MSKNRNRKVSETVTDNHSYHIHLKDTELHCSLCRPHKGCNRHYFTKPKSWKDIRNNQWKEVNHEC